MNSYIHFYPILLSILPHNTPTYPNDDRRCLLQEESAGKEHTFAEGQGTVLFLDCDAAILQHLNVKSAGAIIIAQIVIR
jgi:hypothetical protein